MVLRSHIGRFGSAAPSRSEHTNRNNSRTSSLLRADPQPDGSYVCTRATFDMTGPNGMVFSKDEKTLYATQLDYTGYARRELRSYPVNDDGSLGPHTVLHDFGPHRGIDGMCPHDGGQYRGSRRLGGHRSTAV